MSASQVKKIKNSTEGGDAEPEIGLTVLADGWTEALPDWENICRRAAQAALSAFDTKPDTELSIVLADDGRVRELNRDYRNRDQPTNVLSFPADDENATHIPGRPRMLGDVIVALETTEREARDSGKPLADHLAHLVVHGVLHLLGLNHRTEAEAETMEDKEREILSSLGVKDPYR